MDISASKKTLGRRKIEIKKIEKKTSLQVTFTKRRAGLFRKASELSVLCGAEIAILVQSPAEKIFAFGHPSVEYLLDRFQTGSTPEFAGPSSRIARQIIIREDSRSKYEDAVKKLDMVKIKEEKERTAGSEGREFWWDADLPLDCMELHELEEYLEALESLRDNVSRRVAEIEKLKLLEKSAETAVLKSEQVWPPYYGADGEQYLWVGDGNGMTIHSDLDVAAMWSGTVADQTSALSEANSLPPCPDLMYDILQ